MTMQEIINDLRAHHNRGELRQYLNHIADELEKHTWISAETHPTEEGCYRVILQDGEIHEAWCNHYANGWFWEIARSTKIVFEIKHKEEPKVLKWHPNPEI